MKTVRQWIWLLLAFGVVLFFIGFSFMRYAIYNSHSQVEAELMHTVGERAEKMSDQLLRMDAAAGPVCFYLKKDMSIVKQREAAEALKSTTGAYLVVISDQSGCGYASNHATVSIGETDYFQKMKEKTGTGYYYTKDDGITDAQAIVTAVPFDVTDDHTDYIIMYLDKKKWISIASSGRFRNELDTVINQSGDVIATSAPAHPFVKDGSLWDNLHDTSLSVGQVNSYIVRHVSEVLKAEGGVVLIEAPLMINDWALTTGIDESLLNKMYAQEWQQTQTMLLNLLVAIICFTVIVTVMLILERKKNSAVHEGLKEKAETDSLTGLLNKASTERAIRKYMMHNQGKKGLLFLLDVDNFKGINDTLGHAFGDEALREFGFRASMLFRSSDISGRIGGDEFMIFLKDIPEEMMEEETHKLEEFIAHFSAGNGYIRHEVTASVGGALFPRDGDTFEKLYEAADRALYQSKNHGKSKVTMAG